MKFFNGSDLPSHMNLMLAESLIAKTRLERHLESENAMKNALQGK